MQTLTGVAGPLADDPVHPPRNAAICGLVLRNGLLSLHGAVLAARSHHRLVLSGIQARFMMAESGARLRGP